MSTAEQIRSRPILVTIAEGIVVECRRPDPLDLIARHLLPLELFADVLETIASWSGMSEGPTPEELTKAVASDPNLWGRFIDRWVACAAVKPTIVLEEAEALADPEALWIEHLDYHEKLAIFGRTARLLKSPRVGVAVKEFRQSRPESTDAGLDGTAVRDTAVRAVEDSGSFVGA